VILYPATSSSSGYLGVGLVEAAGLVVVPTAGFYSTGFYYGTGFY
jgi:hypothetical protein